MFNENSFRCRKAFLKLLLPSQILKNTQIRQGWFSLKNPNTHKKKQEDEYDNHKSNNSHLLSLLPFLKMVATFHAVLIIRMKRAPALRAKSLPLFLQERHASLRR